MKKSIIALALTTVFGFLIWLFFSDKSVAQPNTFKTLPAKASVITTAVQPKASNVTQQKLTIAQAKKHFDESIKSAAKQVSHQYAAALNFPPYSQPLTSLDTDRLEPNKFNPVAIPINNDGANLVLSLNKYRFVYPEPIAVRIEGENIGAVTLSLMDVDSKKVLASQRVNNAKQNYDFSFPAREDYPRNLQLLAEAQISADQVPIVAHLQYMNPSAVLMGFDNAWPNSDKMTIPAKLKVHKAGMYRIRANLYIGEQPIAHLVSRERLETGNQTIALDAHWSVLKVTDQPMHLHGFVIELMSPAPGEPSVFGHSEIKSFTISEFPIDSLNKTPYHPTHAERQSLQFLKSLGTTS